MNLPPLRTLRAVVDAIKTRAGSAMVVGIVARAADDPARGRGDAALGATHRFAVSATRAA